METAFTVVGLVFGVVGVGLTILFARRAERINKERRRLDWSDVQAAASDLSRRIISDFKPEAVLTPGLPGATFSNLLVEQLGMEIPVYVGIRFWKEGKQIPETLPGFFAIDTNKWRVMIPDSVRQRESNSILIVDDFAMSGDFLQNLLETLKHDMGEQFVVKTATIVTTTVSIKNHKAPDYYWWTADDDNFYFPWGKAR